MAFVVVLHLSPRHASDMAALLQGVTRMPVTQVAETTPIEADHVYVIPPTKHLSMNDGRLELSAAQRPPGRHVVIDLFFRTPRRRAPRARRRHRAVGHRQRRRGRHRPRQGTGRRDARAGAARRRVRRHADGGHRHRHGRLDAAGGRHAGQAGRAVEPTPGASSCRRAPQGASRPSCRRTPRRGARPRTRCTTSWSRCACAPATTSATTSAPPCCAASSAGCRSTACPTCRPTASCSRARRPRRRRCSRTC